MLDFGAVCELPLLPVENVVLCPGMFFPHRLLSPTDRRAIIYATEADEPFTRLVGVISYHEHFMAISLEDTGCIAEIIGISNDGMNVLTVGIQRFRIKQSSLQDGNLSRVSIEILHDIPPVPIPSIVTEGGGALSPWAYRPFNAKDLSQRVYNDLKTKIPELGIVSSCFNDPLQFSFWLTANLPIDNIRRQQLLDAPDVVTRLSLAMEYLDLGTELQCIQCLRPISCVSNTRMLGQVTNLGTRLQGHDNCGGIFVNSHAVVHDILLTEYADAVVIGDPDPNNSWFEGFGWQIAYCLGCSSHIGWRFTPVPPRETAFDSPMDDEGEIVDMLAQEAGDENADERIGIGTPNRRERNETLAHSSVGQEPPLEGNGPEEANRDFSEDNSHLELRDSTGREFFGLRRSSLTLERENAPALLFGGTSTMFVVPGGVVLRARNEVDSDDDVDDNGDDEAVVVEDNDYDDVET